MTRATLIDNSDRRKHSNRFNRFNRYIFAQSLYACSSFVTFSPHFSHHTLWSQAIHIKALRSVLVHFPWQHVWGMVELCHDYQLHVRGCYSRQLTDATHERIVFLTTLPSPLPCHLDSYTTNTWFIPCLIRFCCHQNVDLTVFHMLFRHSKIKWSNNQHMLFNATVLSLFLCKSPTVI